MLDAVTIAAEHWEATTKFLVAGDVPDDLMVKDCDDAEEATVIARTYRDLIASIASQLSETDGGASRLQ